ncbi:phosphate/phosphite/phosphonate ABC transporter substrate-binding protein [Mycobacteroides abscessus]|uniref:phosphate/phosphite/phosphonate ABC transporter substrate-binding protein n=1 Tax=Mycobacteroides abscessus TaxID=36809 RepID=UPI000D3EB4EA|nr:phosphate/phosphite/phosphonate ABC transporter substrate-binding protein [Mycobacteroides abscessus]PVB47827.1 phosphate ABC transporter substrate-binding protein [Mycobacteroides abscessus]RIR66538.1 phosphate/phosphite/phosphonate ABC transporter substrate-binding protein [Mycobacteroides abscessus]
MFQWANRFRCSAALASILALVMCLAGCGSSSSTTASESVPDTIRVALLPDENAAEVITKNQPLKTYLESELGHKVELVVTTEYSSMIEAMAHGRLELAYFGPLSYVLAKEKADIEPFAALTEVKGQPPTYRSVFVANPASGIRSLKDVAGKTVAWGDPASTSSHLIPKAMLANAGLRVDRGDYQEQHVGAHDAVALAVQNGNAQAGGLSKPIYERLVQNGSIDPTKVVVIAESDPYPNYPWTMRTALPEDFKTKVRAAFLQLEDQSVLKPFKGAGFAPVHDKDYDAVRQLAPLLNINLADFSR